MEVMYSSANIFYPLHVEQLLLKNKTNSLQNAYIKASP